jgi:glycosyltransferase involved in cell wall biosynthesis
VDLSVIIPCHNAAPYIGQAVASVLEQAGLPAGFELEIVIADDRSNDGATPAVLAELARSYPQVRVVANDGARGPGPARNCAVRHARGRWLAFVDADDWWLPGFLSRGLALIAANPDAQWVVGRYHIVYDPGTQQPGRVVDIAFAEDAATLARAEPVPGGLRWVRPVGIPVHELALHTASTWVRRDLFLSQGGFDERLRNAEDTHLWLRLSAATDLYHVPDMLSVYRRRAGSETNSGRPQNDWDVRAHADLYGDPRFRPVRRQFAARIANGCAEDAWRYRRNGHFGDAVRTAWQGLRYAPGDGRLWRNLLAAAARRR